MEIFWLIMGIAIIIFALYTYINDIPDENLRYYFMGGGMAILLSIFRIYYRKNVRNHSN